jgi:hypothetical protein
MDNKKEFSGEKEKERCEVGCGVWWMRSMLQSLIADFDYIFCYECDESIEH